MPEVGEAAPDFALPTHKERDKMIKLSDFRGKKNVVLAFHPLAFTPVCSAQMPAYEKDLPRFNEKETEILSISVDASPAKAAWAEQLGGVSFDLLSDFEPKGAVAKSYGVYLDDKGISQRAIFIIDKTGKIVHKKIYEIATQPINEEIFEVLNKM